MCSRSIKNSRLTVLMTTLRCWWQFWSFLSSIFTICLYYCRAPTFKSCHQHLKLSPILSQQYQHVINITAITMLIDWINRHLFWTRLVYIGDQCWTQSVLLTSWRFFWRNSDTNIWKLSPTWSHQHRHDIK